MSNNIVLKRGLDIPVSGMADPGKITTIKPDVIAIKPTDFRGLVPRLLVREGDKVLSGSPIMSDKSNPDVLFASPVSGTVKSIVRGEKRKLLEIIIQADENQEYVDFGTTNTTISGEELKQLLLKSGLWASIIRRPYGIIADPCVTPKAIFVSAFSTSPLSADREITLKEDLEFIREGLNALSKLASVHVSLNSETSIFNSLKNVSLHYFKGKHPAGNVGVQISHISPIMRGDIVWTISMQDIASIGKLLKTGKYDRSRIIAVTGPKAINPSYVKAVQGMSIKSFASFYDNSKNDLRFISGDILSGENVGENGFLGFFSDQITIMREGREREILGWAKPFRFNQFSSTKSYFSWLLPKKKYDMDTNMHGGPRAFLMSDVYSKVLPMDIYPIYLVKACLAGNVDNMEKYGIYEVLPEDLALCEFTDPSKNEIQSIIAKGIDLMIKEMA